MRFRHKQAVDSNDDGKVSRYELFKYVLSFYNLLLVPK